MAAFLTTLLIGATVAAAQSTITSAPAATNTGPSALPLTEYTYTYPNLPYQVNPYASGRGPQSGYNLCNSTTEGPNSDCQTMFINGPDDFCLWGSPIANSTIGDIEAEVVAYCSKPGHGTRVFPAGTFTGLQFMRTPGYIQITGFINQVNIGLQPDDFGGELDPHGADLAGNPLGGLVFSNHLPTSSSNTTYTQVNNWNQFIGGGQFCLKACDNTIKSPDYCQNIYDLLGCYYNMPNSYTPNEFTDCHGDVQMEPGLYVSDGITMTWTQPASLDPNTVLPWTPSVPPSSLCTTFSSAQLFASAPQPTTTSTSVAITSVAGSAATSSVTSRSGTSSSAAATSSTSSNASSKSVVAGFSGVAAAIAFVVALL